MRMSFMHLPTRHGLPGVGEGMLMILRWVRLI